ncbi:MULTISPECIES: hypothetical protein [Bradyrhizobium]|uniref:hypothetical protein n=1 Tax=Bradyrhizobium TaxID=374 RepID=UPI0012EC840F|nr:MULTISPECIES: hypothetical protein [Bradyrhizobium]QOG23006.1 hypothetical protein FOM02_42890 [Bradyrhizobium sp. SEMIA]UFW50520.1 hypothetical protein BaraCB756_05540 [Bradyrhizobium arachidis]
MTNPTNDCATLILPERTPLAKCGAERNCDHQIERRPFGERSRTGDAEQDNQRYVGSRRADGGPQERRATFKEYLSNIVHVTGLKRPALGGDDDGRIGCSHQQQDDDDSKDCARLGDRAKVFKHLLNSPSCSAPSPHDRLLRVVPALGSFRIPVELGSLAAPQMA